MDKREFPWQPPEADDLEHVARLARTLEATPAHAERIHYVAGTDMQTPNGIRFTQDGELRLTTLDRPEGDGLALWEESIPGYAQAWVLPDLEHGSLFDCSKYFPLYEDLQKYVFDAGQAAGAGDQAGTVLYSRGLFAAMLAARSGAPLIPVGLEGTARAWPHGRRFPRPRPVTVRFHPPIRSDAPSREEKLAELSAEIERFLERFDHEEP